MLQDTSNQHMLFSFPTGMSIPPHFWIIALDCLLFHLAPIKLNRQIYAQQFASALCIENI